MYCTSYVRKTEAIQVVQVPVIHGPDVLDPQRTTICQNLQESQSENPYSNARKQSMFLQSTE